MQIDVMSEEGVEKIISNEDKEEMNSRLENHVTGNLVICTATRY
jgi:hypothetical protein